jgi:hypothetical protein
MLTASAGFADLEQFSLLALGNVTLHHTQPFGLEQLLGLYGDSFALEGDTLTAELPEDVLHIALGTEAEATEDRFARQLATYDRLSDAGVDSLWTAVTGYYAGFFAANALMLSCGRGLLRVDSSAIAIAQGGGLHQLKVDEGATLGHLRLSLTPMTGSASHQATWVAVRNLVTALSDTVGNGPREAQTFTALAALIVAPRWLSKERNDINYDFRRNPFLAGFWPRELPTLTGEEAVEKRILTVLNPRAEQRFELVMVACASLFGALSRNFLDRGGKLDPERRRRRQETLSACPGLHWLLA